SARVWKLPAAPTSLAGTALPVEAVAFSADGTLVAAAGQSGGQPAIVLRDTATGTVKATLLGHQAAVTSLAWSADKTRLISGSADKTVRVWNLADPKFPELARFEGHAAAVTAVALAADGMTAFSGAADNSLKQWKLDTVEELRGYAGHTGAVTSLAVQGATLLSGSADGTARLWNTANGAAIRAVNHGAAVSRVTVTADGAMLASAGADKTIKLWTAANGASLAVLAGHAEAPTDLAFSGDGQRLLSCSADGCRLWSSAGVPLERFRLGDQPVKGTAFAAAGATILAMDAAHALHSAAPALERLIAGHQGGVRRVAFVPAGTMLVTCGADKSVRLWTTADGKQIASFAGATDAVSGLSLSADGKLLAAGGLDKLVHLWPVPAAAVAQPVPPKASFTQDAAVRAVRLSGDGSRLAVALDTPVVTVWDVASGRPLQRLAGHEGAVEDLAWLTDGGTLVSGGADKSTRIWMLSASRLVVAAEGPVRDLALSADRGMLATAGEDKKLKLWNAADGKLLHELPAAAAALTGVALRGDKGELAAATAD
ncbi:MAG: WD40 repeat domain-containing protein, partial [Pirellulaceae bacterium]|nr:WD40 repeat domain-containing protein [Pirellulaceae bacterium]